MKVDGRDIDKQTQQLFESRKVENIFPLLLHICTFKQNLQQGAKQVKQWNTMYNEVLGSKTKSIVDY